MSKLCAVLDSEGRQGPDNASFVLLSHADFFLASLPASEASETVLFTLRVASDGHIEIHGSRASRTHDLFKGYWRYFRPSKCRKDSRLSWDPQRSWMVQDSIEQSKKCNSFLHSADYQSANILIDHQVLGSHSRS